MKKTILLIYILSFPLFAFNTDVKQVFAVAIFDKNKNSENIQHTRETKNDYNGTCYTKVYIRGNNFSIKPEVYINDSKGKYISSEPVYNKKILIGKIMTFEHKNVKQGLLKVFFRKKLMDARVYIR